MNLPKNLRYLRHQKGVKPKDIAKVTKIDAQTIYRWEHNKSQPNDDQLQKISEYYDIDVMVLKNTDLKETTRANHPKYGKTIAEKSPTILSKNIRDLRSGVLKTNRKGLAQKLGVTVDEVSHWEHGEEIPDSPTLQKLADLFGISIDKLEQELPQARPHLKSVKRPEKEAATLELPAPVFQAPAVIEDTAKKLQRILNFTSTLHDLEEADFEKLEAYVRFLRFEKS